MKTDKHLLNLNFGHHPEEAQALLDVMHAYQKQKNIFSDYFNNYYWNGGVNFLQGSHWMEIEKSLMKSNYKSPVGLSARLWKLALKEAYQIHLITTESQILSVKDDILNHLNYLSPIWGTIKSLKESKENEGEKEKNLNLFNHFVYLTNSLFYNFSSFLALEKCLFPYKFNKNKFKNISSIAYVKNFKQFLQTILDNEKRNKEIKETVETILLKDSSNQDWLKRYVYLLVKKIKKHYHQTQQIVTQYNPTIKYDSDCYKLYMDKEGKCFIDVTFLEKNKRIKKIELSGYQHNLPQIKKHKHSSNICVSFDPTEAKFYLHFTFRLKNKNKNEVDNKRFENLENFESYESFEGADYGFSEMLVMSDEKVIGANQGEFLKDIVKQTQKALQKVQKTSLGNGFFGIERENTGRRNGKNNAFNYNKQNGNINYNYRYDQAKINRKIEQYLRKCLSELKQHCLKNKISILVVEELSYSQKGFLGRNKNQRGVFNLTKGFYGLIEQDLKDIVKLVYVNPAFTSQTCPCCGYVDKQNRNGDDFCCLECHYSPDVKCAKADYVGALNIKARRFMPMNRMPKQKVKEILLQRYEKIKEDKLKLDEAKANSIVSETSFILNVD